MTTTSQAIKESITKERVVHQIQKSIPDLSAHKNLNRPKTHEVEFRSMSSFLISFKTSKESNHGYKRIF